MTKNSLIALALLALIAMAFGTGVLLSIAVLGAVVFVHEFGHYVLMRRNGVDVVEFTIGFGPTLFETKLKSGTLFRIKPFLVGGYAMPVMEGERGLLAASPWSRIKIFMAGMFFNACAAFVAYMILLYATHLAPAELVTLVKPLGLPQFLRYALIAFIESFGLWLATPILLVKILSGGLMHFLAGTAGPVGIIQMGSQMASGAGGAGMVSHSVALGMLEYFAMINVALAGFNLLPLMPLDGGRAADIILRKIAGKYGDSASKVFQTVGIALILTLIICVLGMDFWRAFKH